MQVLDRLARWALHPERCLATAALLLVAGIAAGLLHPAPSGPAAAAATLALAVWTAAGSRARPGLVLLPAVAALTLGGYCLLGAVRQPPPRPGGLKPFLGRTCRFEGTISGLPSLFDGGQSVRLDAVQVQDGQRAWVVDEPIRVSLYGPEPIALDPGDRVRAELKLREPAGKRFPGGGNRRLSLAGEGIGFIASGAPGPRFLVRGGETPVLWKPMLLFIRRASTLFAGLGQPADGLLHALILGSRHRLQAGLDESFRLSGLAHLLSVSGIHVSLAGLFVYNLGLFFLRRWEWLTARFDARRAAAALSVPAVLFYTVVTGSQAPAVRSCIMALLVLAGVVLERSALQTAGLALAALLILAWNPAELASASFQLSFLAVAAILAAAARFPGLFRERGRGVAGFIHPGIAQYLAVSAAAFLGTFPLTAYHFSLVAPAGLVANLAAIPLAGWSILPFGLVAAFLAPLNLPLARVAAVPAVWGCELTASLAGWISRGGGLAVRDFRPTPAQVLGLYLVIVSLLVVRRRFGRALLACGAAVLVAATVLAGEARERSGLTATFLDVGEGDATLVELPGGQTILVDAGGKVGTYDRGERVVLPALRARGVRRLDALVLTHAHPDHAGGAPAVLRELEVGEVYVPWPDGPRRLEELWGGYPRDGLRFRTVGEGERVRIGSADLLFLSPPARPPSPGPRAAASDAAANDGSLVCLVRSGGRSLLFAGDAGGTVLDSLARRHAGGLRAEVLKVPHHGSRFSRSEELYAAAAPGVAVVTAGPNAFGHPAPGVVDSLTSRGTRVHVTGQDGSVELTLAPGGGTAARQWSGGDDRLSPAGLLHWFIAGY